MLYVAVDQHAKQLTVSVRNEAGDVVLKRQVSTEWERVRRFWEEIRERSVGLGGFVVILEVCGFNEWLIAMLREHHCSRIVLVQANERAATKTDRRDANRLGELLWVNRARIASCQRVPGLKWIVIPSKEDAENRQLTSMRQRIVAQRTKCINRIKHILLKYNILQEMPTKGIQTIKAAKWLQELRLAEIDRLELDQCLAQWALIDVQRKQIDQRMASRQEPDAQAQLLATIPGASVFSSLALSCRIGDASRFNSPKSLSHFWGLTPRCRNSGASTDRLGSITKEGSKVARFILGQLVLHVLKKDRWMREWYRRIKTRRGSKIARVAVMRRLTVVIWNMLKHREPYQCGGPEAIRKRRKPAPATPINLTLSS